MKLKLPKIKIAPIIFSLKYIYLIILIMIIGVLTLLGYFLYNNLYQTIAQSKEIILLKQEVAPDTIDLKKVNEALAAIEAKTSKKNISWSEIKNPFAITFKVELAPPTN
ncbi:MAG: hypothetical protein A2729_04600 [Candidatus Buchananbacteria bacterium RIFCSPHIGHO2_01_FULL_39_14]|uniref:Uncharacterized protein n=2 Tax=Candidatus Buchananiibacteriota TaxID=1817903 RepID=A0A1G1YPX4_9BACT|nr:MAG: hypothetical protein A2729_04600 [Candidatus Buchananbacteria bacterium RIFCSPHIGHO2_01_FULL_39_14]OGY49257.1 MAG: hypothetical protein A3D39_03105 [Candidatus Buchananbacteria bacterium RIFCSPHIGHO2_02_FULL_39_17]OGY54329.1 MAG: hypothetical protein A2912_04825 [Candidatus Buchananbacteria bacterium RIFCSPLOWO2_01_FULL_40_23b]